MVVGGHRQVAHDPEPAWPQRLDLRRAVIVGQRAAPALLVDRKGDGPPVSCALDIHLGERQAQRLYKVAERAGQFAGKAHMVERGRAGQRRGIDRLEGKAALDRLAIGKGAGIGRPVRGPGNVARQIFPALAQAHRTVDLRLLRRVRPARRGERGESRRAGHQPRHDTGKGRTAQAMGHKGTGHDRSPEPETRPPGRAQCVTRRIGPSGRQGCRTE